MTALRSWRTKAVVQRGLSALPAGHRLNYLLQRATGGFPRADWALDQTGGFCRSHVDAVRSWLPRPVEDAAFYEFGAGWDLQVPLQLWCEGVERQTVVDIRPLMKPKLVADMAKRLRGRDLGRRRPPEVGERLTAEDLAAGFGIRYLAPCDATDTGLPAESVDVITSTATLEHIDAATISAILRENRRLIAPDGVLSFIIDYEDHFSHFDPAASVYQFLAYDERAFRRFNSALHFQNRLRHDDQLELFDRAGFDVVRDLPQEVAPADLEELATIELAEEYRHRPAERLAIRRAHVVLRPR